MKHPLQNVTGLWTIAALLTLQPEVSSAAALDSSQDLDLHPAILLQGGTQNVQTNAAGFYDFGDRNGDGARVDAVSPPDLNMGNYNLYCNNNTLSGSIRLDVNGGDLVSTNGYISTEARDPTGHILIYNVGRVAMGNGRLSTASNNSGYGGNTGSIEIGKAGNPAGLIQINGLNTSMYGGTQAGSVTIFGTNDVLVQDAAGVATNIDVVAYKAGRKRGSVDIRHDGSFLARTINAYKNQDETTPGGYLFWDGDALSNGASGSFSVQLIDSHEIQATGYGGTPASATIQNYQTVTLGSMDAYNTFGYGGSLTITNITGNISITGTVNLDGRYDNRDGALRLTTIGGAITIGSKGSSTAFDLSKIGYASFSAAANSTIHGRILATDGSAADGVTTGSHPIGADLRTPTGQKIYYDPTMNTALFAGGTNGIYTLTGGGTLEPLRQAPRGTVFRFRSHPGSF